MDLAHAAFLGIVNALKDGLELEEGLLTVDHELLRMKLEADTGRLLGIEFGSDGFPLAGKVAFEKGAYESALKKIEEETSSFENEYTEGLLLSSLVRFLAKDRLISDLRSEEAMSALDKLLNPEILTPITHAFNQEKMANQDKFIVPLEVKAEDFKSELAFLGYIFNFFLVPLVPKNSWAQRISREIFFILMGNQKYTEQAIVNLFDSEKMGPLGFLTASVLLQFVDKDKSKAFAIRASKKLTFDAFHKDCRMLLDGPSPLGDCLRNFCDALCSLEEAEAKALAEEVFAPEDGAIFLSMVKILKTGKDKPLIEVFPSSLDMLWELRLKPLCTKAAVKLKG
jgi:hypothetical protein